MGSRGHENRGRRGHANSGTHHIVGGRIRWGAEFDSHDGGDGFRTLGLYARGLLAMEPKPASRGESWTYLDKPFAHTGINNRQFSPFSINKHRGSFMA